MRQISRATRRLRPAALLLLCAWLCLPSATSARVYAGPPALTFYEIQKGDSLGGDERRSYAVDVQSDHKIIVGAFNADPASDAGAPELQLTCDRNPGGDISPLNPDSGKAEGGVVYCQPKTSDGSIASVAVTVRGREGRSVNYGVFAQPLSAATATSFSGLNRAGMKLGAWSTAMFFIDNSGDLISSKLLSFKVTSGAPNRAFARLYNSGGMLVCSTSGSDNAQCAKLNAGDYLSYYLVIVNAGDGDFTYSVSTTKNLNR
ncbi:MAG: hypothetical protein WCI67_10550 [Chloroflexales bacterium]